MSVSLPGLLKLTVEEAAGILHEETKIAKQLKILQDLGVCYLTLGKLRLPYPAEKPKD